MSSDDGGEDRRERRRRSDRDREVDVRVRERGRSCSRHVRLREAPERAGLHARRVEDEARLVGEILQGRLAEDVVAIRAGDAVGDRPGQQDSLEDGGLVDRLRGEVPQRLDEELVEVARYPVVEAQLRPVQREDAVRDRAAGHARDPRRASAGSRARSGARSRRRGTASRGSRRRRGTARRRAPASPARRRGRVSWQRRPDRSLRPVESEPTARADHPTQAEHEPVSRERQASFAGRFKASAQ